MYLRFIYPLNECCETLIEYERRLCIIQVMWTDDSVLQIQRRHHEKTELMANSARGTRILYFLYTPIVKAHLPEVIADFVRTSRNFHMNFTNFPHM